MKAGGTPSGSGLNWACAHVTAAASRAAERRARARIGLAFGSAARYSSERLPIARAQHRNRVSAHVSAVAMQGKGQSAESSIEAKLALASERWSSAPPCSPRCLPPAPISSPAMSLDAVREYLKAEPFNSVYYDGEYKKP